jgi:hypothetical protein
MVCRIGAAVALVLQPIYLHEFKEELAPCLSLAGLHASNSSTSPKQRNAHFVIFQYHLFCSLMVILNNLNKTNIIPFHVLYFEQGSNEATGFCNLSIVSNQENRTCDNCRSFFRFAFGIKLLLPEKEKESEQFRIVSVHGVCSCCCEQLIINIHQ